MPKQKTFKWIVEFSVTENWVADGFEMTKNRALEMLSNDLGYAYEWELDAKIVKAPKQKDIRKVQGFKE